MVDESARPDFRVLDSVIEDIGRALRSTLVLSVETTLPVTTTRERIAPMLARLSGREPEREFFTVHSPERVYAGRIFRDLETYPKLVGGLSAEGERRAVDLYRQFLRAEIWPMGTAEAAEFTKVAETTYRDVNIGLANEFARYADSVGLDLDRVIEAANSQPFSHIHRPGVAVGGHCIPVYPRFYLAADPEARLPRAAREVNEAMPAYALDLLEEALGQPLHGQRILILGATYRGGVKETAFSGVFPLRDELRRREAIPLVHDPLIPPAELEQLDLPPWDGASVDGAVIQADHPQYRQLRPQDLPGVRALIDGRDVVDLREWRGVVVRRIGRPG
jgi:UDP-N-acetyl-D-mannosaminuronic acid dehydrogenase